jgi:hypothetical protein
MRNYCFACKEALAILLACKSFYQSIGMQKKSDACTKLREGMDAVNRLWCLFFFNLVLLAHIAAAAHVVVAEAAEANGLDDTEARADDASMEARGGRRRGGQAGSSHADPSIGRRSISRNCWCPSPSVRRDVIAAFVQASTDTAPLKKLLLLAMVSGRIMC